METDITAKELFTDMRNRAGCPIMMYGYEVVFVPYTKEEWNLLESLMGIEITDFDKLNSERFG